MAKKTESKLTQSEGSFVLRGIITGKDNPTKYNGYKEGTIEKGENKGKSWRSIRFLLKTSSDNSIPVELYGAERSFVNFYNKKEKINKKAEWSKKDLTAPDGYELIVPEYDIVKKINDKFHDGEVVLIVGQCQFSTYVNNSGVTLRQIKYVINRIHSSKEALEFDKEDFIEKNEFTQDIVINSVEEEKEDAVKKLIVDSYIIGYNDSFFPATFEIDVNARPKFAKNFKTLKFGDVLKARGKIHYRVKKEVVESDWGEQVINDVHTGLEITGVIEDSIEKRKYKEEDFVKPEQSDSDKAELDWSNVSEKVENNKLPFDLD